MVRPGMVHIALRCQREIDEARAFLVKREREQEERLTVYTKAERAEIDRRIAERCAKES